MGQLVESLLKILSEEEPKMMMNKGDIEPEKAKLETLVNTFLVKDGGLSYPKYYSRYQAGFVGKGCADSTCGMLQPTSNNLEQCIQNCHAKRAQGFYSVSYNPAEKQCYCSKNKFDFVQKSGHLHYRFPRSIYGS